MSLINDALKRAQQAQATAPPPSSPGPQLQPVEEPTRQVRRGLGLMLPAALVAVALLALFFVWQLAQKSGSARLAADRTQIIATEKAVPSAAPPATTTSRAMAQPGTNPPSAPLSPPAPVAPANSAPPRPFIAEARPAAGAPTPVLPGSSRLAQISGATNTVAENGRALLASASPAQPAANPANTPDTNAATVAEPSQPKPASLKLQAIVFSPTRPSALINGKTLFIGDPVGEFRLVGLTRDSATLAGAGQTNVLNLAQ